MKAQHLVTPECCFSLQGSIRDIGMLLLVARALLLNCPASISMDVLHEMRFGRIVRAPEWTFHAFCMLIVFFMCLEHHMVALEQGAIVVLPTVGLGSVCFLQGCNVCAIFLLRFAL